MQKLVLIAGALAMLSMPALAGSATGDRPMVLAEGEGVSVSVGGDHDRDHHRHVVVVRHHHDEGDEHH